MASNNIRAVKELKESLSKELNNDDGSSERCLDLLKCLDESFVDIKVLSETLVGTTVSKLKSNENKEVASMAKSLVKKWKQVAKKSGKVTTKSVQKVSSTASSIKKPPVVASAETEDPSSEWDHLSPHRANMAKKFNQIFKSSEASLTKSGINSTALASLCKSRATEVEESINNQSKGDRSAYSSKIRTLIFNLKKNSNLRENVILGSTIPETLVTMAPEQLATEEIGKKRSDIISKMQESRRLDWEQANEDKINEQCGIKGDLLKASLFTCGRCKSTKTTSTQKQTRSADEPMTVFVFCINCGNRWKC